MWQGADREAFKNSYRCGACRAPLTDANQGGSQVACHIVTLTTPSPQFFQFFLARIIRHGLYLSAGTVRGVGRGMDGQHCKYSSGSRTEKKTQSGCSASAVHARMQGLSVSVGHWHKQETFSANPSFMKSTTPSATNPGLRSSRPTCDPRGSNVHRLEVPEVRSVPEPERPIPGACQVLVNGIHKVDLVHVAPA